MEEYLPDLYQKSIYTIDYDNLYSRGIKCLLFNIDNTIVTYKADIPSNKLKELFNSLKDDYKIVLFSNVSRKRVKTFKDILGCESYNYKFKPKSRDFNNIMRQYHLEEPDIAFFSDDMVRDIYAGNKAGITTILVNPISKNDGFVEHMNRKKEDAVMQRLRDMDLFIKGKYYD